jgi:hypothetical protein
VQLPLHDNTLTLTGGPADDAQEIYALYPMTSLSSGEGSGVRCYTLGKLLAPSYKPLTINVALVPVNGAPLDKEAIATALNKVYNTVGIRFNVSQKENYTYEPLINKPLAVEGSGLFSVYTDQMKALNSAYTASLGNDYQTNTLYLFALNQGAGKDGSTTILGDMPRGKQFGYLFTQNQTGTQQGQTAAHEIGHGAFQLQHTFSYSGLKQGDLSDNVMDYADLSSSPQGRSGGALSKLQWDLIHDPGLVVNLFETDKGAEYNNIFPLIPKDIIDKVRSIVAKKVSNAAIALTTYAVEKLKELPKVMFEYYLDKMSKSDNPEDVSLALTTEFILGIGPEIREFDGNHPFTKSLKYSNLTKEAIRSYWDGYQQYNQKKRTDIPTYYKVDFSPWPFVGDTGPIKEYRKDSKFTAAQFVGTAIYIFDTDEKKKIVNIKVYDTKSEYSFLYHIYGTDRHKRNNKQIMGETTQYYYFSFSFEEVINLIKK